MGIEIVLSSHPDLTIKSRLRVRAKINSHVLGVEAPVQQGVQSLEYQDISAVGQRSWKGWIVA
jgi:hypothetical protein